MEFVTCKTEKTKDFVYLSISDVYLVLNEDKKERASVVVDRKGNEYKCFNKDILYPKIRDCIIDI